MKNKKKIITGLALLTSLTIFAAGTSVNNNSTLNNKNTTETGNNKTIENRPRIDFQRMEELKTKLKNGTATKSEMAETAEILERKRLGKKGNRSCNPENENCQRPDFTKIEEIKTKLKNRKSLTKEESDILLEILERKGSRGVRSEGTSKTSNKTANNEATTVKQSI